MGKKHKKKLHKKSIIFQLTAGAIIDLFVGLVLLLIEKLI